MRRIAEKAVRMMNERAHANFPITRLSIHGGSLGMKTEEEKNCAHTNTPYFGET